MHLHGLLTSDSSISRRIINQSASKWPLVGKTGQVIVARFTAVVESYSSAPITLANISGPGKSSQVV
jgi:hypothetical protein